MSYNPQVTYSQKYCLVYFTDDIAVGTEFDMADWPLHITLADVFAASLSETDFATELDTTLKKLAPVTTKAIHEAKLGDCEVVLVKRTPDLQALHVKLIDLLEANGAVFNVPGFVRDGFLPHSTIQKAGRLYKDDPVTIDSIALVDMFPDNNWQRRKVLRIFKLYANNQL